MNSNGKNPIAKRKIPFSPVVAYAIGNLISVQTIKIPQNRFPTTLCCENELYIKTAENAETMIPKPQKTLYLLYSLIWKPAI